MKIIVPLIFSVFLLEACGPREFTDSIVVEEARQIDSFPAECPYLTKDEKTNMVLSWLRRVNDSTAAFCYAVSTDGVRFSAPIVIPKSDKAQPHGENLPKIIFKPNGQVWAFWGSANPNQKNKYSGRVFYSRSSDKGKTWTTPEPLVEDSSSIDQRYYDVAVLPDGEIGVIWLDNRRTTKKEGSALYFARTEGDRGLGEGKLISEPCCPCCRTDLFVDQQGGIHALFRGIVQDSIRDMVHIVSVDGGVTFSNTKRISEDNWVLNTCPHTGPAMTENSKGLHFAWYTGGVKPGCFYTQSSDNGKNFEKAVLVSVKGSHPQIATLKDERLFIVWDESQITNNRVQKRIGIQFRNNRGKMLADKFISPAARIANFPVISPLGRSGSMVAYTMKKGDDNYVYYQRVDFSNGNSH